MPSFLESAALALGRTATDLLPLSGDGHAALASMLFGLESDPRVELAGALGAWLATVAFLRRRVVTLAAGARTALAGRGDGEPVVVGVGALALLVVGFAVRERAVAWGHDPMLVGASLLLSAGAVASTLWAPPSAPATAPRSPRRPAEDPDLPARWGALLVGAVSGVAMLPGLSRTAVALASLLWLGARRERAFELCFLISIPADGILLAAGAFEEGRHRGLPGLADGATMAGTALLAAGVATLSLRAVRVATLRRQLPLFALYLVPLAVATMAWAYARP